MKKNKIASKKNEISKILQNCKFVFVLEASFQELNTPHEDKNKKSARLFSICMFLDLKFLNKK